MPCFFTILTKAPLLYTRIVVALMLGSQQTLYLVSTLKYEDWRISYTFLHLLPLLATGSTKYCLLNLCSVSIILTLLSANAPSFPCKPHNFCLCHMGWYRELLIKLFFQALHCSHSVRETRMCWFLHAHLVQYTGCALSWLITLLIFLSLQEQRLSWYGHWRW